MIGSVEFKTQTIVWKTTQMLGWNQHLMIIFHSVHKQSVATLQKPDVASSEHKFFILQSCYKKEKQQILLFQRPRHQNRYPLFSISASKLTETIIWVSK